MTRVAVVTGAGSGMGLSIADRLGRDGYHVALLDRDGDAAQVAAERIRAEGGQALAAPVDVSDRSAVDDALALVHREFGPVEIMVTSAGIDEKKPFTEITLESWERIVAVNLTGTFHSLQAVVPDMVETGWGRIVTISSSSAQSGASGMAHYVASKGGVIALTKALALELAPHGVTVNTIPPGFILTPMLERAKDRGDIPDLSEVVARTPVRRAGSGDDIAAACAFLCSEDAGYITGQSLNVNGGWYL